MSCHWILALIQSRKSGFGPSLNWSSGPGCPHCLPSSASLQSAACMSDFLAALFSNWGSLNLLIQVDPDGWRTWTSLLLNKTLVRHSRVRVDPSFFLFFFFLIVFFLIQVGYSFCHFSLPSLIVCPFVKRRAEELFLYSSSLVFRLSTWFFVTL